MLTTQEPTASRWRPLAIGATAAVALAFTTGRTDVECGAIKQPRACNPTPGCGFWEICFKNAEDYIAAYKRGDVVHCRSIKDEMRGVRIIRVSSAPDICLSGWARALTMCGDSVRLRSRRNRKNMLANLAERRCTATEAG